VDRLLDPLADELAHYGITVAGIQETKWFGSDVCLDVWMFVACCQRLVDLMLMLVW